jgi:hypothetical protein
MHPGTDRQGTRNAGQWSKAKLGICGSAWKPNPASAAADAITELPVLIAGLLAPADKHGVVRINFRLAPMLGTCSKCRALL